MDYKIIIIGLILIGIGGGLIWGVVTDDLSIGDSVQQTTIRKYDRSIVSQTVREYGVLDVIIEEIFPVIFGIGLICWGVFLIKVES